MEEGREGDHEEEAAGRGGNGDAGMPAWTPLRPQCGSRASLSFSKFP